MESKTIALAMLALAMSGAPAQALADGRTSGFTEIVADGAAYRVYTLLEPRRRAAIHVGQRLADREALVRSMALRLLLPGIVVVLLLSLGAWFIVRRVTAPVVSLSAAIDARAFDRFYRATPDGTGAGLGLALVKRVAELHGGEVRFTAGLDGAGLGVEMVFPGAASPSSSERIEDGG